MTSLNELQNFPVVSKNQFQVSTAFRWILAGPSGSGKTQFVKHAIKNPDLFKKGPFNKIYYFTRIPQSELKDLDPSIEIYDTLPSEEEFEQLATPFKGEKNEKGEFTTSGSLFVLDDFGQNLTKSLASIFQILSRHLNASVFLILQCLFSSNPLYRELSLNSTQITIFRNIRDKQQIKIFARQICEGDCNWIKELFSNLCKYPYTYLHFDLSQECPDNLRIRTNIFKHEGPTKIFTERKQS